MRISIRLIIGFLIIILLMVTAISFSIYNYSKVHDEYERLKEDIIPNVFVVNVMEYYGNQVHLFTVWYALRGEKKEELQAATILLEKAGTEHFERVMYAGLEEQKAAGMLQEKIKKINSIATELINLKDQGVSIEEILKKGDEELHPALETLLENISKHKALYMEKLTETKEIVHELNVYNIWVVSLAGLIMLILACTIAMLTIRAVAKPVRELTKASEIIGSGNLDYKVKIRTKDEIGQLGKAFNKMAGDLKRNTTSIDKLNREITERKQAEARLEEAVKVNRDIVEKAPFGVYIINKEGIVEFVNKTMLDISGNRYEDFIGLNMLKLPTYSKKEIDKKLKAGLNGDYFKVGPIEYESYIGKKTTVRNFYGIPLKEKGEKKLIVIVEDITEIKTSEKLKDEFVSTVSHELRTPLSITKEGISLILDELVGGINKDQKKILNIAKDNTDRLARIVDELLNVSKIESGKVKLERESVNVVDLTKRTAGYFKAKIKDKGLEIKIDCPKKELNIYIDPDKIIQVFTNLIANSIRFTEKGNIKIVVKDHEKFIECAVADTGKGVSKHDLKKIFDKFEQFGRISGSGDKGTGLGLAIAKNIIEMHKGKIKAESELGEGTKITFTLPKDVS